MWQLHYFSAVTIYSLRICKGTSELESKSSFYILAFITVVPPDDKRFRTKCFRNSSCKCKEYGKSTAETVTVISLFLGIINWEMPNRTTKKSNLIHFPC